MWSNKTNSHTKEQYMINNICAVVSKEKQVKKTPIKIEHLLQKEVHWYYSKIKLLQVTKTKNILLMRPLRWHYLQTSHGCHTQVTNIIQISFLFSIKFGVCKTFFMGLSVTEKKHIQWHYPFKSKRHNFFHGKMFRT